MAKTTIIIEDVDAENISYSSTCDYNEAKEVTPAMQVAANLLGNSQPNSYGAAYVVSLNL